MGRSKLPVRSQKASQPCQDRNTDEKGGREKPYATQDGTTRRRQLGLSGLPLLAPLTMARNRREMKPLIRPAIGAALGLLVTSEAFAWGAVGGPHGGAAYRGPMGGAAVHGPAGGAAYRPPGGGGYYRPPPAGAGYRPPPPRPYYPGAAAATGVAIGAAAASSYPPPAYYAPPVVVAPPPCGYYPYPNCY